MRSSFLHVKTNDWSILRHYQEIAKLESFDLFDKKWCVSRIDFTSSNGNLSAEIKIMSILEIDQ